jgi:Inorganic pyrophosphatase
MDLCHIPVGENPPHEVNVVIEIPQGGAPVKYEVDKASGAMFVDRFLHTAMFYPANYGFIPHTLSEDGDPLDCMVIAPTPVAPGAVVRARPIGALLRRMRRALTRRSSPCPPTSYIPRLSPSMETILAPGPKGGPLAPQPNLGHRFDEGLGAFDFGGELLPGARGVEVRDFDLGARGPQRQLPAALRMLTAFAGICSHVP